ncbi:MAG: phosphoribosyl-AMP cyclohydrolase [Alphaproteobacteria bacterium]
MTTTMPDAGSPALPASPQAVAEIVAGMTFDANGLVAAIAQQHGSGEVLMLAWMDRDAVAATLTTGYAHYYSRSRKKQWKKGESSGQVQKLVDFRLDCDGDAVLLVVEQTGVACHTGRHNCFFRAPRALGGLTEIAKVEVDPAKLYGG